MDFHFISADGASHKSYRYWKDGGYRRCELLDHAPGWDDLGRALLTNEEDETAAVQVVNAFNAWQQEAKHQERQVVIERHGEAMADEVCTPFKPVLRVCWHIPFVGLHTAEVGA